jgi:flagellar protein FlgJ
MEPISTLNYGASLTQNSKSFPLKDLADKARHLTGVQNRHEGIKLNKTESLSMVKSNSTTLNNESKELMEVAQKFEAILIHQMLKAMRKTVHKSDLLNSFSLQQYESMMDEEIANEMTKQKGIGLADDLFYQLRRLDESFNQSDTISNKTLGNQSL